MADADHANRVIELVEEHGSPLMRLYPLTAFALVAIIAAFVVAAQARAQEARCTELDGTPGADCICSEPLEDTTTRAIPTAHDFADSPDATECNQYGAFLDHNIIDMATVDAFGMPGSTSISRVMENPGSGGNILWLYDSASIGADERRRCYRYLVTYSTDFSGVSNSEACPSGRNKMMQITVDGAAHQIQEGGNGGSCTGPPVADYANTWLTTLGPYTDANRSFSPNVEIDDCWTTEGWCMVEMCVAGNLQSGTNISLDARITTLSDNIAHDLDQTEAVTGAVGTPRGADVFHGPSSAPATGNGVGTLWMSHWMVASWETDSDQWIGLPDEFNGAECDFTCGNGAIECSEQCDDGDEDAGDGCSATCTIESGWSCDGADPTVCSEVCGNGVQTTSETCDDGNTTAGDGCSDVCATETSGTCGDGVRYENPPGSGTAEECDDGNTASGDGCSDSCAVESGYVCVGKTPDVCTIDACGDGVVTGSEECDDGNTLASDGCSATCTSEGAEWSCSPVGGFCDPATQTAETEFAALAMDGNVNNSGSSGSITNSGVSFGSPGKYGSGYGDFEAGDTLSGFTDQGGNGSGAFWIRKDGWAASGEVIVDGGGDFGLQRVDATSSFEFFTAQVTPATCATDIVDNAWHFVRFGWNATESFIWVDGAECGTGTGGSAGSSSSTVTFGSSSFVGHLDEIRWLDEDPAVSDAQFAIYQIDPIGGDYCSDSWRSGSEVCDDGNVTADDGCASNCLSITAGYTATGINPSTFTNGGSPEDPFCGDGSVDSGEECDPGDNDPTDCCSATCQFEAGILEGGYTCRPSAGSCDQAEFCTGDSATCPADVFYNNPLFVCRESAGPCDPREACDGSGATCPTDDFYDNTVTCRADAGACDVAEVCTGTGAACPTDAFEDDGTACPNATVCDGAETCQSGVCTSGTALMCESYQACNPESGCFGSPEPLTAASGGSSSEWCNTDTCTTWLQRVQWLSEVVWLD